GANSSSWNCASNPLTIVFDVASARAPAFAVYPSSTTASFTRCRTSAEIVRLPDRAYDAVLRDTPAARATSPIVTTRDSSLSAEPVRRLYQSTRTATGPAPGSPWPPGCPFEVNRQASRPTRPRPAGELRDRDVVDHRGVLRAQVDPRPQVFAVRDTVEVRLFLGREHDGVRAFGQLHRNRRLPEVVLVERAREEHALGLRSVDRDVRATPHRVGVVVRRLGLLRVGVAQPHRVHTAALSRHLERQCVRVSGFPADPGDRGALAGQ